MKPELQAIIGPVGSGFEDFVRVYSSSLPEMIDFDNSATSAAIYDEVRGLFGAEWWNVPAATQAKDVLIRNFVNARPWLQKAKEVYLTTEPAFLYMDGDLVGVLPLPSDITLKLKQESAKRALPVPATIGTGMRLYNSYRDAFLTRRIRYFQTVTEAFQSLQSLQSYAV